MAETWAIQCIACARWRSPMSTGSADQKSPTQTCDAFPDGIPAEIWANQSDHRRSYAGDHGLQWAPLDGAKFPEWAFAKK